MLTHLEISMVNATEHYRIYDDVLNVADVCYQDNPTTGEIFAEMRSQYGRCTSKVYIDTDDGPRAIGWVFQKRAKYDDSEETYLQETWISCLSNYDPRPRKEYATI